MEVGVGGVDISGTIVIVVGSSSKILAHPHNIIKDDGGQETEETVAEPTRCLCEPFLKVSSGCVHSCTH